MLLFNNVNRFLAAPFMLIEDLMRYVVSFA